MQEPHSVAIRVAQPSDTEALIELYRALLAQQSEFDAGWTETRDFDWQGYIDGILRSDSQIILTAVSQREIVGFAHLRVRSSPDRRVSILRRLIRRIRTSTGRPIVTSPYGYIESVIVRPSDQRKGIGQLLMTDAESWFASRSVSRVETSYYSDNDGSRALLNKMGYRMHRVMAVKSVSGDAYPSK